MEILNFVLSRGDGCVIKYVPTCGLGDLSEAPLFYSELAWYEVGGDLVGLSENRVVAPLGSRFLSRFEYSFLGGGCDEYGYEPEVTKGVAWEPIGNSRHKYYREGYACLDLVRSK